VPPALLTEIDPTAPLRIATPSTSSCGSVNSITFDGLSALKLALKEQNSVDARILLLHYAHCSDRRQEDDQF